MQNTFNQSNRLFRFFIYSICQVLPKLSALQLLLFLLVSIKSFSQEDSAYWKLNTKDDVFWQPNCPLMDGFSLWLLRQKLSIDGTQTILQSETDITNNRLNKIQITNYLPIIKSKTISSMIGTRYSKYDILSDNENLNKTIQHIWLWTALEYKLKRWNFILTTENYLKGDEIGLYDKTGNKFFTVFYCGYELNSKWNIILMGGYDRQEMENKIEEKPLIAIEARYQPSEKLKILFGVPTIFAFEWSALKNTDLGFQYFVTGGISSFIQQRITKRVNFSILYNKEINDDTYFKTNTIISNNNNTISFNNISLTNSQLSAEIGFLTTNYIGINIGLGYNFKEKLYLQRNTDRINSEYYTKPYLSINLRIQYLKL